LHGKRDLAGGVRGRGFRDQDFRGQDFRPYFCANTAGFNLITQIGGISTLV
jgi:hypothetical protein